MPKITIFEKDVTYPLAEEVNNNIVYVPGYAITGPVNTPVLCHTLSEFQEIFGLVPYTFVKDTQNTYSDSRAGDYEKSYIYAADLLNSGLPVIFERYMSSGDINNFTATARANFTTTTQVEVDNYVLATNSEEEFTAGNYYVLNSNSDYIHVGIYDSSVEYYTYDTTYNPVSESLEENFSTYYIRISDDTYIKADAYNADSQYFNKITETTNVDIADTSKYLIISAKNPGEYGTHISCSINLGDIIDGVQLYDVTTGLSIFGKVKEIKSSIKTISFDINRPDYYKNVEFDLINLDISADTVLTKDSTLYFTDTLNLSLTVLDTTNNEFNVTSFYSNLKNVYDKLTDRNEYDVKFITSGAYPTYLYNEKGDGALDEISTAMLKAAAKRGDSVAVVDYPFSMTTSNLIDNVEKSFKSAIDVSDGTRVEDSRKYGAMFAPYAIYHSSVVSGNYRMPASYGYLISLATSIRNNANWYAVAGVARGLVPNLLQLSSNISGAEADRMQSTTGISINPITNIKPYGYCIWGNRTLNYNRGLVASSFLNIRILSNDVKKEVYRAAKKLTFELNNDILWLNFKAEIEPLLDKMVSGNGLSRYKIIKKTSTKRATVEAIIRLYAIEAVEDWDITIELADSYTSIQ